MLGGEQKIIKDSKIAGMETTRLGECNVMGIMAHRAEEKNEKLNEEDIEELAKFFYLLWQCDERNKREGRYGKKNEG